MQRYAERELAAAGARRDHAPMLACTAASPGARDYRRTTE